MKARETCIGYRNRKSYGAHAPPAFLPAKMTASGIGLLYAGHEDGEGKLVKKMGSMGGCE